MNNIDTNIAGNLSPLETKVFDTISDIRKRRAPSTVVRVAGGWVRDKLLNQPSDDIDFMVDNMSGADFADLVSEELGLKGPHVIEKNPEKTKNIEAAKMYIPIDGENVELDFVQARTESYGDNRREVITAPASAEEDAMRRDLTIGALFYNVNTGQVEDFTGKGLKDLITGTIRTPSDDGSGEVTPENIEAVKATFIEDPLRIFRAVRFAAKYKGNISPVTMAALSDKDVINATFFSERKIASERIGQELQKIMKGANPNVAFDILKETGMMQIMLNEAVKGSEFEGQMEELDMDQNNSHHDFNLWGHTMAVFNNLMPMLENYPPERRVIMLLAAITHDLGKLYRQIHSDSNTMPGTTAYKGHEKESKKIAELLLRYLKFESSTVSQVASLAQFHMQPHQFGRPDNGGGSASSRTFRKFIRTMGEKSIDWMDVITLSTADAYSKGAEIDPAVVEKYKQLRSQLDQALASLQMDEAQSKIKPVLNGNEIMQALNIRGGAHMGQITEFVAELRDENPDITKEEAISRLQQEFGTDPEEVVKQANAERDEKMAVCCPKQLFDQRFIKIKDLIGEGSLVEAATELVMLIDEYGKDPKVARLAAITTLKICSRDESLRDNELLTYVFEKAERDFFDPVLGAYAVGLLLIYKTATEDEVILEIGERVSTLAPGLLRSVINMLPKKVYQQELRDKIEKLLK